MKPRLLVIDDDPAITTVLAALFDRAGYDVATGATARDAIDHVSRTPILVTLLDLNLGSESGLDVLPQLKALRPEMSVIVVTARQGVETVVAAMQLGAENYVVKPLDPERLLAVVAKAVEAGTLRRSHLQLSRLQAGRRIDPNSSCPAMTAAVELAARVAPHDTTVLLLGETGTGKGVLARYIHDHSPRATRPFVELNCAGLQRELTESELFGYEKGAFTGAANRKIGLFEAADGGTLLLDEIGEMDLAVQAKLLKVLEDRRFRRVGGTVEIEVDVRLIAATHRDLETEVAAQRFRRDLWYRLNVFGIALPPLRDRRADIATLARLLIREHGHSGELAADALEQLEHYGWPGNVRELRNVLERAAILCAPGQPITVAHLPRLRPRGDAEPDEPVDLARIEARRTALDDAERAVIQAALEGADGVVARAARELGLPRTSLVSRMQALGLESRK